MSKTMPQPNGHRETAPALPAVLPEPTAGGNYLRDPITGALTLNPAHEIPQE